MVSRMKRRRPMRPAISLPMMLAGMPTRLIAAAALAGPSAHLKKHGADRVVGQQGKTEAGQGGEQAGKKVDAAGVYPVGQARENGHRQHVAGEEGPSDSPGCGPAQVPEFLELRQQSRPNREAGHAQRLGQTEQNEQFCVGEGRHPG